LGIPFFFHPLPQVSPLSFTHGHCVFILGPLVQIRRVCPPVVPLFCLWHPGQSLVLDTDPRRTCFSPIFPELSSPLFFFSGKSRSTVSFFCGPGSPPSEFAHSFSGSPPCGDRASSNTGAGLFHTPPLTNFRTSVMPPCLSQPAFSFFAWQAIPLFGHVFVYHSYGAFCFL